MKYYIKKLWVRFLMKLLKKGAVTSELAARILVHYTLVKMQEKGQTELEIEYEAPEISNVKLIMVAYLTEK
ncbi:hypothetical protein [Sphingobacterium corticibacter]|uniref:hypothetical protein n=1 Tax=Sphingobacterium corticibacter TaxID=2171749 RepID=UPI00105780B4|nr:hypothetical protein [Sphingobacterium corticibacter]